MAANKLLTIKDCIKFKKNMINKILWIDRENILYSNFDNNTIYNISTKTKIKMKGLYPKLSLNKQQVLYLKFNQKQLYLYMYNFITFKKI